MRKLFLFLTAALVSTGMWATDFEITLDQLRTNPLSGLVNFENLSDFSLSGGSIQLSSGNKDFTISSRNSDYKIKQIVFTTQKAVIKYNDVAITDDTFSPTTPATSFTLNLAASGGTAKITQMVITLTTSESETLEELEATALTDGIYTTGSTIITLSTNGGSYKSGPNRIQLSKSSNTRSLTIATSDSYNLQFVTIYYYDAIFSRTITASTGTYTPSTYTWTPGSTSTNTVTLTFATENAETTNIRKIYVGYASAGYSITFEENGHGEEQEDLTGQFALPNTLPTLSETGWIFDGWYTNEGLTDEATPGASISQNTTLYAKWTEDPSVVKYHVTYDLNGASGDAPTQDDAAAGVEITLAAAPSWEHHTFDGWLCSIDSKVKAAGSSYTMTAANTTFTAQWTELFAITEGTPANGSVDADLAEAPAGATVTLTATPATDYLFDAWDVYKTGEEGTKVTVTDNQFTMPAYAVTVSASFIADTRKKILYLTTKSAADTKSGDKMYAALKDDYNVKIESPESQTLTNYDLIVLHESIGGTSSAAAVTGCKTTSTPVLNTKSWFYGESGDASKRWGWGKPDGGQSIKGPKLNTEYCNITAHPIFAGLTFVGSDSLTIFSSAKAKAMQPIKEFASGKEGYTLATSPKSSGGTGCAIQEIPAGGFRGATSGKYLLISIGNENGCFGLLTENGQNLIKNAVAYLLSDETWTPKTLEVTIADGIEHGSVDADITCAAAGDEITLSNNPSDGYKLRAYDVYKTGDAETKVPVTDGKFTMPAYAVTVSATFAELINVTCATGLENGSVAADKEKAIEGETVTLSNIPAEGYILDAYDVYKTGDAETKVTVTDGKFTMPAYAVTVSATFKKDSSTALDNTNASAKAVKRLENGMLVIEKNGHVYNVLGGCVK